MKRTVRLSEDDRCFFRLVHDAAFVNPFSEKRLELNRQISGLPRSSGEGILDQVVTQVAERVGRLEKAGRDRFDLYDGEDAELVRSSLLFEAYHRCVENFDDLLRQQMDVGEDPCPVPFASDSLSLLRSRGFKAEEARHCFSFFYQLRRAFYFIGCSLVGDSPAMGRLRCRLWDTLFTHDIRCYERFLWNRMEDFSTLLLGETGTGKGAAAAAIGRSGYIPYDDKTRRFSESFTGNFIALNLSQFPESLIESELFGHKKGAFTGAVADRLGVFSRCTPHGTIFLDEIGDVSVPVQVKLLKVLQERTFTPVGGYAVQRFRGRVVAATSRSLDTLRQDGGFRDDFYYRLCSDVITVPPLRQHLAERPALFETLVRHVLIRIVGDPPDSMARSVLGALKKQPGKDYRWPGNVRELEQAVRRVLLTRTYSGEPRLTSPEPLEALRCGLDEGSLDAQTLLSSYCRLLYDRLGTYEDVARRTGLDRRTVKKYIQAV